MTFVFEIITQSGGGSLKLVDFYKVLQKVKGVIDVVGLEIKGKVGATYSNLDYSFTKNLSADGRRIAAKENIIFDFQFTANPRGITVVKLKVNRNLVLVVNIV